MGYPVFQKDVTSKVEKKRKKKHRRENKRNTTRNGKATLNHGAYTYRDRIYVLGFICFILLPSFVTAVRPFDMSESWKNALVWMNENTKKTSYYLHPGERPEYSVLSWWDYGNWIVYVAKRPVICNNFQAGAVDAAKFFTAQSEDEAFKIVKKRGVKFVITCKKMQLSKGKFLAIMRIAGMNPDLLGSNETLEIYNNSIFYKLHFENAANLTHFRLLKDFGDVKIFVVT